MAQILRLNVIVLAGGTQEWQNEVMPSETCTLYQIAEDDLQLIADIGEYSIGDAGTWPALSILPWQLSRRTNTDLFSESRGRLYRRLRI